MTGYYFDYNATTPLLPEIFQAMAVYLTDHYGNPSSSHEMGQQAAKALKDARRKTAGLLGAADDSEIIFTSGATESTNAAFRAALHAVPEKREIVTSAVEHSSVRKLCAQLQKEGYVIHEIGVNRDGQLDLGALYNALNDQTALVSLMMANNETGVYFPVEAVGKKIKERGIFFHVDGVQAVGKHRLILREWPIDFFSISAHKFYGPKGVGVLYVRKGIPFYPLIAGGSQERGRRAGTENVAGIAGMGAASEWVLNHMDEDIPRLKKIQQLFETEVKKQIPGVSITGEKSERLVTTSHLCIAGVESETLLAALDQKGIYASSGSACMSGAQDPSHVLKAMGYSDAEAKSAVRFSFGVPTTEASIFILISELRDTVQRLRAMNAYSPLYAGGAV